MPKTIFKASFDWKKPPRSSFNTLKLLPKYKKPSYMVSILFMLLKIPPFLHLLFLLSCIYSLHKVETTNKNYWRFFKIPLHMSVIILKVHFLKGLEDRSQSFLHKDREAIQTPVVCAKMTSTLCDQSY